jgi:hypothetical protein
MTEDIYSRLLTALSSSRSDRDTREMFQGMLSELGNNDPQMKLMAAYLARQQEENFEDEDENDDDGPGLRAKKKKKPSLAHLRNLVNDMYMELEDLREKNDNLAAALGACYLCWGEDPECQECSGRGQPGFFAPDENLFAEFVIPALKKMKRDKPGGPGRNVSPHPGANINISNQKTNTDKGDKNE